MAIILKTKVYKSVVALWFVVVLLLINTMAHTLNYVVDMTDNKLYALSEETQALLDEIDQAITIYVFDELGKENLMLQRLLEVYQEKNPLIDVTYVDPIINPMFASQYLEEGENLSVGSVVVVGETDDYVIQVFDFYEMSYDENENLELVGYRFEEQVSNALLSVTNDQLPKVHVITGHKESALPNELSTLLTDNGFQLMTSSLKEARPMAGEDLLIFVAPQLDILEEEYDKVSAYLEAGGGVMFFMEFTTKNQPVLDRLLLNYGIEPIRGMVFEGDSNFHYTGAPNFLLPKFGTSDQLAGLSQQGVPIMIPLSMGLNVTERLTSDIAADILLSTSDQGFVKTDINDLSYEKTPDDQGGEIAVAINSSKQFLDGQQLTEGKMVVIGTPYLLDRNLVPVDAVANKAFLSKEVLWLSGQEDRFYMPSKKLDAYQIILGENQLLAYGLLFVGLIPVAIAGFGIVVWVRRKHL